MKQKTRVAIATFGIMALGIIGGSLSSCSAFFGEDGYAIKDISWVKDEDSGNVIVTIKTTDEENPELTFRIPQGMAGVPGVGIKDISSSVKSVGELTEVTLKITYTDDSLPPTILTVPLRNGTDGKGVSSVEVSNDSDGNIVLQFLYSDGSKSQPIVVPRGKDGIDGVGIKEVLVDDSNPLKVVVTITFSDESLPPKVIELPKGIGIQSVKYDAKESTSEHYVLLVTYSDGFIEKIRLPRPKSVEWYTGTTSPEASLGKEGDFYLNTVSGFVYKKVGAEWVFLFSMKGTGSAIEFTVTFHPNGGTWKDPLLIDGATYTVPVKYGEYISLHRFPTIEKAGQVFTGWMSDVSGNPNAGKFTDLTPVLRNMDLYASWSAISK